MRSKAPASRFARDALILPAKPVLVGPVVGELEFDPHIASAQQGDDGLQIVSILARDAHRIALNAGLHLLLGVLDQLDDLLGLFDRDALLEGHLLAHALPRGRFHLAPGQVLERDAAFDQLLAQNVLDRFEVVLVGRG